MATLVKALITVFATAWLLGMAGMVLDAPERFIKACLIIVSTLGGIGMIAIVWTH